MNEINEYADEMIRTYGVNVYKAVHESKLRGDVLIFFMKNPFHMTISQVSRSMRVDYSNIKRVIKGGGGHYAKDRALIFLGLLNYEESNGEETYSINFQGFNAAVILEKERESKSSDQSDQPVKNTAFKERNAGSNRNK
ncbi:Uncharacterized protein conserved in archaea [Methanocella conradii HZ254]|uniref:Uncharacterized protein conserved in archaea n=1 Tax=Methanocella conradii (strain DSM 24694 / JCM 17849 / CGMCC 1.5162 / HZ254) TaxID=1041930 RepID=H8IAD3_METCZ|nr:archaellum operon transcriptional activator EarA family protein [Methanocella conradii]AFC99607.1 Uncharacterized protein conserved in archaea [Methanocella conradii HZ254]AFC99612.1 Uncharacterized protein conserved in archaea [Methanocella conradii HZ254]